MTIEQSISDFLRDGQYRIGEITVQLNESELSRNSDEYNKLWTMRHDLIQFIDILYNARYSFIDNKYRFLDWTDLEIQKEIEYLRYWSGVNEIPYFSFVAYYPWIVNNVVGSGGVSIGIPNGNLGQYLVYGLNNSVVPQDFPDRCGVIAGENINDYFSGRL